MPTHPFTPENFPNFHSYEKNATKLERAQRLNRKIFDVWVSMSKWIEKGSPLFLEIISLLDDAVQLGYEEALEMPHKSSDYNIVPETLNTYDNACQFCKNMYYFYGCEESCTRIDRGLKCKLDVKENIE